LDAKLAAILEESDSSGSEYQVKGGASEDETDNEEDIELEDDEPDTTITIRKGKKQKRGLTARDQVSAAVAAMSTNSTQTPRYVLPLNNGDKS
jgi:hypothetical protein